MESWGHHMARMAIQEKKIKTGKRLTKLELKEGKPKPKKPGGEKRREKVSLQGKNARERMTYHHQSDFADEERNSV